MKHSTDVALQTLFDLIDDALKDREVCGVCLGRLLLAASAETVRCLAPDELERLRPEIDRIHAGSVRPTNAH